MSDFDEYDAELLKTVVGGLEKIKMMKERSYMDQDDYMIHGLNRQELVLQEVAAYWRAKYESRRGTGRAV